MASPPTGIRLKARRTGLFGVLSGTIPLLFGQTANLAAAGDTYFTGTVRTTNGTQADVQAKINAAVDRDIIEIPAGNFTWTSGVSVSGKAILIRGAGGGRVEGSSTSSVAVGTGSKTFTLRAKASGRLQNSWINGFTAGESIVARYKFDAAVSMTGTVTSWNASTGQLVINVTSVTGSGTRSYWTFEIPATTKITHNAGTSALFDLSEDASGPVAISDLHLVEGTGSGYGIEISNVGAEPVQVFDMRFSNFHQSIRANNVRGIYYRCYFDQGFNISNDYTNNSNGIIAASNTAGTWSEADSVGARDTTNKNMYIEDCYFVGQVLGCVDFNDNCRGVIRRCVMDNSGFTLHGADTSVYGQRHLEAYDNLMIFNSLPDPGLSANMNYWFAWRSGSGIVTENEIDDISSWAWGDKLEAQLELQNLRRNAGPYACWNSGYPAPHQTGRGSNGSGESNLTEGVYFYNNTGTMNVSPIDYEPDQCGNGSTVADYIQLNRDYFTRAPNSGEPFYGWTKFTYPHPDREA